jgi:hypothetical protein
MTPQGSTFSAPGPAHVENRAAGVEKAGDNEVRFGAGAAVTWGSREEERSRAPSTQTSERGDKNRPLGATWVVNRKRILRKEVRVSARAGGL